MLFRVEISREVDSRSRIIPVSLIFIPWISLRVFDQPIDQIENGLILIAKASKYRQFETAVPLEQGQPVLAHVDKIELHYLYFIL